MADQKKKGKVSGAIKAVGADIRDIGTTFAKGDWNARVSFLIMCFGPLTRKQGVRGSLGLVFTFISVIFLYIPLIYQ